MKRNLISSLFAAAVLMGSGIASAQIVGGVDFGGLGTHLETTTVAETVITGVGQTLRGYGQINTVNGNLFYAGTQRLYFDVSYTSTVFTPNPLTGVGDVLFTGGVVNIYLGNTVNLLSQNSLANLATIAAMTPWVRLTGHAGLDPTFPPGTTLQANGQLTGQSLSFTGTGLLDIDTSNAFGIAAVRTFLNTNGISDFVGGLADMVFTSSANNTVLNPNDVASGLANGCRDGTAQPGAWCVQGSADLRGILPRNVPEPGSLALVGLSLIGLAVVSRRKKGA